MATRSLAAMLALALAMLGVPGPGQASTIAREDGDDSRSRLDLASVRVSHVDEGSHAFTISTHDPFTNAAIMYPNGILEVGIDLNDEDPMDGDTKYEFYVFVLYRKGALRGELWNRKSERFVSRSLETARVSGRTVRVTLPLRLIGSPRSYRFAAFSYAEGAPCSAERPCVDAIPNRYPVLLHDFTPPKTVLSQGATFSTSLSATLAVPFYLWVTDDRYGSGIDSWVLRSRPVGTAEWTDQATGSDDGRFKRPVRGAQGDVLEVWLLSSDGQGNVGQAGPRKLAFPYDETDPAAGVAVTFGPAPDSWTTETGNDEAFLGTYHYGDAGDTVSIGFTGSEVCLIGRTGTATASYVLDGADPVVTPLLGSGPRASILCVQTEAGEHTIGVTVLSGTPWLDAIGVLP